MLIESFMWNIYLSKILWNSEHVNGLVSSVLNSNNICKPFPLNSNTI